eukprot:3027840-Prymnesium_polylepis.1
MAEATAAEAGTPAGAPPADAIPWLGVWTQARVDDDAYDRVLAASGIPWAVRKLLQSFTAQRELVLPPGKPVLFRSSARIRAKSNNTPPVYQLCPPAVPSQLKPVLARPWQRC